MLPLLSVSRLPCTSVEPLGLASTTKVGAMSDWDDDEVEYEPEADEPRPSVSDADYAALRYEAALMARRFRS